MADDPADAKTPDEVSSGPETGGGEHTENPQMDGSTDVIDVKDLADPAIMKKLEVLLSLF